MLLLNVDRTSCNVGCVVCNPVREHIKKEETVVSKSTIKKHMKRRTELMIGKSG